MTRIGIGIGMGFQGGSVSPLSILGTTGMLRWVRADLGVTPGPTLTWADQSGSGNHYTQATGAAQATLLPTGLNGKPTFLFDGIDDFFGSALSLPAPGTTPTWRMFVLKQITWTANDSICGGTGANTHRIRQVTGTPAIDCFNGSNGPDNSAATLDAWVRIRTLFANTTGDYLRVGSTNATGVAFGNSASVGTQLACQASTVFWNGEIGEELTLSYEPTAAQQTALDAYVSGFWSSAVAVG